jgi:hypothetical protein
VFGQVLTGLDVITRISTAMSVNLKPSPPVVIKAAAQIAEGSAEWAAVDKELKAKAAAAAKAQAAAAGAAAAGSKGKEAKEGGKAAIKM